METQDIYICVDLDIQEFNSPDKQHLVNIHSVPQTEMNEAWILHSNTLAGVTETWIDIDNWGLTVTMEDMNKYSYPSGIQSIAVYKNMNTVCP